MFKSNKKTPQKKEIAGLNRRISELEKANKAKDEKLKEAQREKMSEEEKLKAEQADLEETKASILREKRDLLVTKALVKAGLDPDRFSKRIVGDSEAEILQDVQDLKDLLDSSSREIADKKVKDTLKVDPPKKGTTPKKMTLDEISKLPNTPKTCKGIQRKWLYKIAKG